MDDFPWFYVAMIFIAFVGWLRNQIVRAAETRRERSAQRKAREMARRTTEPDPAGRSPYVSPVDRELEEPATRRTFRDVFEDLERQVTAHQEFETEPAPTRPPPLPTPTTYSPAGSSEDPPQPPLVSTVRSRKKKKKRHSYEATPASTITGMLSQKKQLRTALILNEILDSPRAYKGRRIRQN
ncbi:MAG: hypothetical protein AAGA96_19605 [Verrucomicrobiota bacterium]